MPKRDDAILLDIVEAIRQAIEFRGEGGQAAFVTDRKSQSAVLHQLLVVGEAVKRLSAALCQDNPDVPWTLLAKLRDRLIHGYDSVDLTIVWQTVHDDLPSLLPVLEQILAKTVPPAG